MTEQPFSLIPFPGATSPAITIDGRISLERNLLRVGYSLAGDIAALLLPRASTNPGRRQELWKSTCFEIFLAIRDQPQYWEFNLSPSGHWNAYRMDAYRRIGFREETSIQALRLEVHVEPDAVNLRTEVDLTPLFQEDERIQLAVAAVIQTRDDDESYWALTHPAGQADFHTRESFILAPGGRTHPSPESGPVD